LSLVKKSQYIIL